MARKPMIGLGGKPILGADGKPLVCEPDTSCCDAEAPVIPCIDFDDFMLGVDSIDLTVNFVAGDVNECDNCSDASGSFNLIKQVGSPCLFLPNPYYYEFPGSGIELTNCSSPGDSHFLTQLIMGFSCPPFSTSFVASLRAVIDGNCVSTLASRTVTMPSADYAAGSLTPQAGTQSYCQVSSGSYTMNF